ncbi:MAG: HAMP domain-containing protein [Sphaerospermopsis sp. SIO1G1]|nr:HAMP domain-containing protein [Sphaerospermopsis sp. SIO1G1]
MAVNKDDQNSNLIYQQAADAYGRGDYQVAATLVDEAVNQLPSDPDSHLLRGHIYYVLEQYEIAKAEYEYVFHLTDDQEILDSANQYLEQIQQSLDMSLFADNSELDFNGMVTTLKEPLAPEDDQLSSLNLSTSPDFDDNDFDFDLKAFGEYEPSTDGEDTSANHPFATELTELNQLTDNSSSLEDNPFSLEQPYSDLQPGQSINDNNLEIETPFGLEQPFSDLQPGENVGQVSGDLELPAFWQDNVSPSDIENLNQNSSFSEWELDAEQDLATINHKNVNRENELELISEENPANSASNIGDLNIANHSKENKSAWSSTNNWQENIAEELDSLEDPNSATQISGAFKNDFSSHSLKANNHFVEDDFDSDDFDPEAFESAFGADSFDNYEEVNHTGTEEDYRNNIEFLDDFEEFNDLGSIPNFDLTDDANYDSMGLVSDTKEKSNNITSGNFTDDFASTRGDGDDRDEELFTITGAQEAVPVFTKNDPSQLDPNVSVEQGIFAFFENASLEKKQWYIAGSVSLAAAVAAALISFISTSFSPPEQRESVRNTGWAMSLSAGLAGGITAGFMGNLALKQIRRTTKDLQSQFDSVRQGNLNVQATVYSEDELGYLATSFNEMSRVIFMTTNEAQRKAVEQEEAKENLQRQVIRLLDDVEGAARGDLTVQAEVTADVLGAVADAFNLTIQNLRDIVQQVKVAAKEVTKGSTNSETFARALSGDALRQAEELGVTLNSVQKMTESIKDVADAAKEAEKVARDASVIALKGGKAVENTVAGILEIRETVAETTRKVKRLAESSQEINSIVALVSQIASRTNLLALNASIEAVRAGEAGRGFAIVADEVRQLADKSAKSLKDIEQIVMQIQSETSSVMTAMEEGTQQVIRGTQLAEDAKRSLEDIIQVADHIDELVRSITTNTVEQTETSSAVAQVMQSVEITAQHTSQEAQRVSGALQNLVGVSRDLIASVERFRVETIEPDSR